MSIYTERFEELTGYDISNFYVEFSDFVKSDYQLIIDYYRGNSQIPEKSFIVLNNLTSESVKVLDLFTINAGNLSNDTGYWKFLENFEDIYSKIQTINNTAKWQKSSFISDYEKNVDIEYILSENETPEKVSSNLGYIDPDNDYQDLLLQNQIKEEDYTKSGGVLLKASFQDSRIANVNVVVAIMIDLEPLGRDLTVGVEIIEDDFLALTPKETITQAANILLGTIKGSIPEFPEDGLPQLAGSNRNYLQYPILFRELTNLFKKDDTFQSIEILGINRDQDNIFIEVRVASKFQGINLTQQISI